MKTKNKPFKKYSLNYGKYVTVIYLLKLTDLQLFQ